MAEKSNFEFILKWQVHSPLLTMIEEPPRRLKYHANPDNLSFGSFAELQSSGKSMHIPLKKSWMKRSTSSTVQNLGGQV